MRENQNHKIMWLKDYVTLKVGGSRSKSPPWQVSGRKRSCDKWDLMLLISHITSHRNLFKWSYDFMVESPSS